MFFIKFIFRKFQFWIGVRVNELERREGMIRGWTIFEKKKLAARGAVVDSGKTQAASV